MSRLNDLSKHIKINPLLTDDTKMQNTADFVNSTEMEKEVQESFQKKKDYEQAVLKTLQNIENNTADIGSLVSLIQQSNENQEEVLKIVQSIMEITTAKTEGEADNKYREVMNKANQLNSDMKTIDGLITHGKMMWIGVKLYLKKEYLGE